MAISAIFFFERRPCNFRIEVVYISFCNYQFFFYLCSLATFKQKDLAPKLTAFYSINVYLYVIEVLHICNKLCFERAVGVAMVTEMTNY